MKCTVRPPVSNCAATADVAHVIGALFRIFAAAGIAFMVNVSPVLQEHPERIVLVRLSAPRSHSTRTHHPQGFNGSWEHAALSPHLNPDLQLVVCFQLLF